MKIFFAVAVLLSLCCATSYAAPTVVSNANKRHPKSANAAVGGPRNGRYTILSYGNIYNPITLGYFDLKDGTYTFLSAAKRPIGSGTYAYNASTKKVSWITGPLKDYGATAAFETDRGGKTHKLRLKYSTIGTNSLN